MKQHLLKLLVVAFFVLISSAASARAQAPAQRLARIPFDFQVRGELFAAGEYSITTLNPQSGSTAILLRSKDGKVSRIFLVAPASPGGVGGGGDLTLTFNRYGANHFLSEVRNPSQGLSARVSKTKSEKSLARLSGEAQTVSVPACSGAAARAGLE